jgi:pimeloyl-ACP methyl ester carboxylesterase
VEEISIRTNDNTPLHSLLFRAGSAKGVIFYLHGNAGSVRGWGEEASVYTALGYDVFMPDYRGYGKSEGTISSENQIYEDMQAAYNELKERYAEKEIVVLGYSIGTGPATKIAATNYPRLLILQTPYYSLPDVMREHYPIIPTFLLKYRFETYKMIQECRMPVVLFHGTRDEVIPYQSSVKLKALLKEGDQLITLSGAGHNGITSHPDYEREIRKVLLR